MHTPGQFMDIDYVCELYKAYKKKKLHTKKVFVEAAWFHKKRKQVQWSVVPKPLQSNTAFPDCIV